MTEPKSPRARGFRLPAEWSPHCATWICWPHNRSDFPGKLGAVRWAFAELVRKLAPEPVHMIVQGERAEQQAKRVLSASGVDLASVTFHYFQTDRSWVRDFMPLTVTRRAKIGGKLAVNFRFTGWGRYGDHRLDDRAGQRASQRVGEVFVPRHGRSRWVLEGGAVDTDGEGALLATERCLLGDECARNPGRSREDNVRMLRECLGIERVLWLPDGIAGDDTSGHVDDFVRFVAPGAVVLCEEPNGADDNHAILAEAREHLQGAKDANDRALEIVALPMPSPLYFRGERLPASYANFYIGEHAVVVPTFNDDNDRVALGVLAEVFPDRRVVGVHAVDWVLGLGTLHCSTMQEPEVARES